LFDERCHQQSSSPNQKMATINHGCSPSFARIGEQDDLLLPAGPHRHSPPLPVKAGWRGVKPSLDASCHIASAACAIKRDAE
jgi:hypothetical protein